MEPRLLKGFLRWLLNLRWPDAAAQFYSPDAHEEYLAEKQRDFERCRMSWFLSLDDGNVLKAMKAVKEDQYYAGRS